MVTNLSDSQLTFPKISVRKGREWQVAHGHPWLFSGAISQAPKTESGAVVDLVDTDGRFVARGYYNATCDIAVRILTREKSENIDRTFLKRLLLDALALRRMALDADETDVYRLVNAEADFLPGFIVDYYAGVIVVQSHTAGADRLLDDMLAVIEEVVKPISIIVRNDAGVRKREGLEVEPPRLVSGAEPKDLIVKENGLRFFVDPSQGQKTGFFTDQRDKRAALQRYCRRLGEKSSMLNCFSYTGSFSVYAHASNPVISTVNVDQSQRALDEAVRNFELNNMKTAEHQIVSADAFEWLEQARNNGDKFDVTVLDPPAFAKSQKDKVRALKAYKRMDRLGIEVTKPGGLMVTCSCSGPISFSEFHDALRDAAAESGRGVQILETFQNGLDHPINVAAQETGYLKVIFCRIV